MSFISLLESSKSKRLEAEIGIVLVYNLADEALEGSMGFP